MIGADLEGADLESRVVSSLRPHRTLLSRTFAWTYVPIPRHHHHRRPRGSQGNKPGNDHDPRYRGDATSASSAAVRSGTYGGHWKITQYMCQQLPEQSEGAAPASSGSATRIRARSASACGRRARRGAGGHVDLPARTGAGQVDVGVAGAVRVPALGAVGAAGGHEVESGTGGRRCPRQWPRWVSRRPISGTAGSAVWLLAQPQWHAHERVDVIGEADAMISISYVCARFLIAHEHR
jgi:hypothetical protein